MSMKLILLSLPLLFLTFNCSEEVIHSKADIEYVKKQVAKFAPVTISFDSTLLDEMETKTLQKIIEAAKIMDEIFLEQVYSKNTKIKTALMAPGDQQDKPYLDLFTIMFGPFNRLEENRPFINNTPKPDGANFDIGLRNIRKRSKASNILLHSFAAKRDN